MPLPRPLARLVARAKPVVPDAVWPTLLTLRSVASGGPVVGLPDFRRVLVLVAHPDDEAIACAGTVALLSDAGASVEILALTDGEATIGSSHDPVETARRRRAELAASAAILGATATSAGLPDGRLHDHVPAVTAAIEEAIARTRPEVVLAPWLGDGHRDHRAVARALAACSLEPDLQIWGYETWAAVPHNRLVDVTPAIERKRRAVAAHETGSLSFDLSSGIGLSRWRAMHGLLGKGYGEAYLAMSPAEYVDLAKRLDAAFDPAGEGA